MRSRKTLVVPPADPYQRAAFDAGGTLIYGPRFHDINEDIKLYAPGCGAPTSVSGTNGGFMPCGGMLTGLDGKTEQVFCGACERDLKMKLTLRKALEICIALWRWLEQNPNAEKFDWPGWEKNGGDIPNMQSNCSCCEYTTQQIGRTPNCIPVCPLKSIWPAGCINVGDSPFRLWELNVGNHIVRRTQAKVIADAAERELKKLDQDESTKTTNV